MDGEWRFLNVKGAVTQGMTQKKKGNRWKRGGRLREDAFQNDRRK